MLSNRNPPQETKGRVQWGLFTEEGGRSLEWTDSLETWQRSTVVYLKGWGGGGSPTDPQGWFNRDMNGASVSSRDETGAKMGKWQHKQEGVLAATPDASTVEDVQLQRCGAQTPPLTPHFSLKWPVFGNKSQLERADDRNAVSLPKTSDLFHNGPTLCKNACTSFPVNTARFQKANTTERIHNLANISLTKMIV